MDLDAVAHGPTNLSLVPAPEKTPAAPGAPTVRDRADRPPARVLRSTNLLRSAGLPPRLGQRGPRGGRIGEAAGQQVEGEQLEEDRQEEHPARRREDGQRRNGLRKVDELFADLHFVRRREGTARRRFRQ